MKQKSAYSFLRGSGAFPVLALALLLLSSQMPLAAGAVGDAVTPQEAQRAALAWLHLCPAFRSGGGSVAFAPAQEMLAIQDREGKQTLAYVLELQPTGFIVVTPSFDLYPIVAYSERTAFDTTETSENVLLALLRGDIAERLEAVERGDASLAYLAEARLTWISYLDKVDAQGQVQDQGTQAWIEWDVQHGPFLTSEWSQGSIGGNAVYNYYTPPGPDGSASNYVCGCVATALGQILNYYEWPATGTGSHSYVWNTQTLSADFGATTYDWANVLDDYKAGSTLAQRQAVGLVTYHAGVAVDMSYASGGSGAYTADVAAALENYFRHSSAWVANTGSSFYDRLYDNMVNHRPSELSIRDTVAPNTGGHAIVVDGVQYNTGDPAVWYHMNMGWNGSYNDWYYDIASGFTTGSYTWDTISGAILDIVPTPDLVDPGAAIPDSTFPVSWSVSPRQGATSYELQQALLPDTLGSFADGAEGGMGNWTVDGNWQRSSQTRHAGTYSFKGYVAQTSSDALPFSSLTLDRAVKIDGSTTIQYWWGTYYFHYTQARLEVSTDEKNWTTLRTHTSTSMSWPITWNSVTVNSAELAAYVGQVVSLRFVIDAGASWYYGTQVGFWLDDFSVTNCYSAPWATVDANLADPSQSIAVVQDGEYAFRARANAHSQGWDWSDPESVTVTGLHNSATTGNWHTGSTWTAGTVPGAGNSAIVNANHIVMVDSNAVCHDLNVLADGYVYVPYGVTLGVGDDLANSGTLEQAQDVNGSGTVGFFDIGGYGGVLLNASGADLGRTLVTIEGHRNCTAGPEGSSVSRCFTILPENASGRNATMRLYFSTDELGAIPCGSVQVWQWDGDAWQVSGTVAERQCTTEPYYVETTGVTDFSSFVIDDDTPPDPPPTAISLIRFEAFPGSGAIQVEWETASEIDNLGFNLYRSESPDGLWTRLNDDLIPSQVPPGSPVGATYTWLDEDTTPGVTYYYRLEDVDVFGVSTFHGPIEATLPQLQLKSPPAPRRIGP